MPAFRGQIGRNRGPALTLDRRGDGPPDRTGGAGDEHELVFQTSHGASTRDFAGRAS